MTLITDSKRRVTLPPIVKPGTAYDVEFEDENRLVLRRLVPVPDREVPRIVTRKGRKVLAGGPKLTGAQLAEAINQERDERAANLL